MMPSASVFTQALRWLRLSLHMVRGAAIVLLLFPAKSKVQQGLLRQRWCQQLLTCLGVDLQLLQALPVPPEQPQLGGEGGKGCLWVANHISWLDVLVLNACAPMDFVAKAELRQWPFLGWLAQRSGTLFLPRYSPQQAQAMNIQLSRRLQAGARILVFPEGSSSLGLGVLPFYPALFQAAIDARCSVQPVALRYSCATGQRSTAPAYAGEISWWQSLRSIIASSGLRAQVQPCPLLTLADGARQRRRLAQQARAWIVAATQSDATPSAAAMLHHRVPHAHSPQGLEALA